MWPSNRPWRLPPKVLVVTVVFLMHYWHHNYRAGGASGTVCVAWTTHPQHRPRQHHIRTITTTLQTQASPNIFDGVSKFPLSFLLSSSDGGSVNWWNGDDDTIRNYIQQFVPNMAIDFSDIHIWKERVTLLLLAVSEWMERILSSFSVPNDDVVSSVTKQIFLYVQPTKEMILSNIAVVQDKFHALITQIEAFDADQIQRILGVTLDLQSRLIGKYPELEPLIQAIKEAVGPSITISSPVVLVATTWMIYIVVNAARRSGPSSSSTTTTIPSQPYPMNQYNADTAKAYFDRRPLAVATRASSIAFQSLQFGGSLLVDQLQNQTQQNELQRGRELATLLTRLGPTFIKVGQSLSIRTDLLQPAYIRGLETLQDQVPAFDTKTAQQILEAEWGQPITAVLTDDLSTTPIAAASLGQVYKARLRASNEEVAIKVQRPDIMEQIALDMYLIRVLGAILKRVAKLSTDTVGTVDAWGKGFVDELDYIQEAANGKRFSEQILDTPLRDVVFAPAVVTDYSTRSVLVTSWVNGERLDRSSSKDVSVLCSIAMNTYLTMLLEFGLLHCDPHPGNLLCTPEGKLCIMDWGMVTRLDNDLQLTLIEHMAHLTSADYAELPRDLLLLGFVPEDKADAIADSGVVEVLADIYGAWTAGGGAAAINVNQVIAQLQDLTARKGNLFRIPPYFAYIAKSFSVLEGIGLSNDPKYSIINECLPYVSKRLLTDNDKMGPALSTFIFGPDKSDADRIVNYRRVEQLVEGFGEYTTSSSGALLGKVNLTRSELLDDVAEQVLDLVFTEDETPLQKIFLEQIAKILSSSGRLFLTQLRERSGTLPSGRTRLGTFLDPLGLWRTSPLVRINELDERTVETTQKLVALMQRQMQNSDNPLFDFSTLTREESFELSSILVQKVWSKRTGVLQTSNRFARMLLQLTANKLESGERDTRRLPARMDVATDPVSSDLLSTNVETPQPNFETPYQKSGTSQRLEGARRLLDEVQKEQESMLREKSDLDSTTKYESQRLAGARKLLIDLQQNEANSSEVVA